MANEITFDKLPQAVGYLTEQVERIHKIVEALQPQTTTDTQGETYYLHTRTQGVDSCLQAWQETLLLRR